MSRINALPVLVVLATARLLDRAVVGARRRADERGQATAEYALVLLGVAAIALAVVSWVTRGGLVGRLLDAVFGGLLRKIT